MRHMRQEEKAQAENCRGDMASYAAIPPKRPEDTRILLVRHCEAQGNTMGVFQGQIDTDISENGEKQLELLALRCRNMPIEVLVSSPLKRAVKTAQALNRYHGLPLETDPLFAEINAGGFEGVPWKELPEKFPEESRLWYQEPWKFRAPGGESMEEVYQRTWKGVEGLLKRYRSKWIAVCSHGCAIRNLLCRALGLPLEKIGEVPWMDNTALSVLEISPEGEISVPVLGDASHLSPETSGFAGQSWWSAPENTQRKENQ